jgi:23S rRNA (guanosine2251-2'-O)-methyltransferase
MRTGRFVPPRPLGISDPSLALAGDDELVAGRRPVEEAFVARREARRLLVVPQRRLALEKLVLHATSLRIPVVEVEGGTLTSIAGFDGHQGIALVVAPRRFASPDEVLALAVERSEPPLVLVLDSLEDPQNVGTLLRSAEASGVHGAVFPTRHQAPLSPAAVKASAGAVEHLRLAPVDDLPGALADLHARGLRIIGADGDAPLTAREADLRGPIAIVVGSEGKGLGPAVRRRCDLLVRIPMHGRIESLNAAVAGSILLYEAAAQRRLPEAARPRSAAGTWADRDAEPEADAAAPDAATDVAPVPAESVADAGLAADADAPEPVAPGPDGSEWAHEPGPDAVGPVIAADAADAVAPEVANPKPELADAPARADEAAPEGGDSEPATAPTELAADGPEADTVVAEAAEAAGEAETAESAGPDKDAPEPGATAPATAPAGASPRARTRRTTKPAAAEPVPGDDDLLPGGPSIEGAAPVDERGPEPARDDAPEPAGDDRGDPAGGVPEV